MPEMVGNFPITAWEKRLLEKHVSWYVPHQDNFCPYRGFKWWAEIRRPDGKRVTIAGMSKKEMRWRILHEGYYLGDVYRRMSHDYYSGFDPEDKQRKLW